MYFVIVLKECQIGWQSSIGHTIVVWVETPKIDMVSWLFLKFFESSEWKLVCFFTALKECQIG